MGASICSDDRWKASQEGSVACLKRVVGQLTIENVWKEKSATWSTSTVMRVLAGRERVRASQPPDHFCLKMRPGLTRPDFCSLRPPPRPSHPSRPPCRQHRRREQQKIHQQHPEHSGESGGVSSRGRAEKTVRGGDAPFGQASWRTASC